MLDKQTDAQNIQKKPLISFIVTAYNLQPEMVGECIESICALSLCENDREIILVDDGSDVPTILQVTDYQDCLIYVRQCNRGLSEARNAGLRMAKGRFVQFVDGDDKLIAAPYEHCLDIVRYEQPDMVLFDYTHKTETDVPFEFQKPVTGVEYMNSNNIKGSACTYIFRRDILGSLTFTPDRLCEDEEFTPQLILRAQYIYTTNAHAYFYRKRAGSIINSKSNRHIVTRLNDVFEIICHLQHLSSRMPEDARQALQRRIAQLSMDYLYNTAGLTHSIHQLEEAIRKLRDNGLYPLPDKNYTLKYKIFRKMISTRIGRYLLVMKAHRR